MAEGIQQDDLFRLRFLQDAALSPDGRQVVYTVMHTQEEKADKPSEDKPKSWRDVRTLWLLSLADGNSRQLTANTSNAYAPAWSPSGEAVAFLSDRQGTTQIFLLPMTGGEARPLTSFALGVTGRPVWSPDGSRIAFTVGPQDAAHADDVPYRFTRRVYRFDGMGMVDRAVQNIFSVDVDSSETKQWTDNNAYNVQPEWSPDGQTILFQSRFSPEDSGQFGTLDLVDGEGNVRTVLSGWRGMAAARWLPDGKRILFAAARGELPIGTQNDLWSMDIDGSDFVNHTEGLDRQVAADLQPDFPPGALGESKILVDAAGESAYVQVQDGGEVPIYRVSLKEKGYAAVVSGERSCFPLGLHGDTLIFAVSELNNPTDLFSVDLGTGAERQWTQINRALLEQRALPKTVHMTFAGEDGVDVEGWVMLPATGQAPFPGFLYIHGGPHSGFGHVFSFDFQMLAGAGYAVIFINHRASTGYGNAFATAIKGDWGHLDYTDLMAGVDAAIERGLVDGERLALGGLSGGGNLTCWIVGQTDRFKAAIPENPVTNWVSFYGVSDIGPWFAVDQLGGHPHEIPDVYQRCSPITYAHRCKTPTLLIQGNNDWRCPAEQSEQFYAVLKVNGCPVEMVRLPNSSHAESIGGAWRIRKVHNEALMGWVKKYVEVG
ncbi:prolyl oligopeptidase family serine peptidase [bacterium]|nr:prolyl oligopeptidase family serine peptidase [bacterium]